MTEVSCEAQIGEQVREAVQNSRDLFLHRLQQLVTLETPSLNPSALEPALELTSRWLEALDFTVRRLPGPKSGGHLLAYPRTRSKGLGYQLLLGHLDTVWPLGILEQMPFKVEGDRVAGPGVYDMKAGLVMMLSALEALNSCQKEPALTPVLLINSDEEVGSFESTKAIRRLSRFARRAFVLEPSLGPEGKIKTARKGVGGFTVRIHGRAAHAGLEPERGVSAILELSHVIQSLFALNDPSRGVTVNVGTVDGGLRANVIAPSSEARVDVRVLRVADARDIEHKIMGLKPSNPAVTLEIHGGFGRPPLEPTPRNQKLWRTARRLGRDLGMDLEEGVAGGGSDGNTCSLYTATLDGLGAVGDSAHNPEEHIVLSKTLERTLLLAMMLHQKDGVESLGE